MAVGKTFLSWPVVRQLTGKDPLGRGPAVRSQQTEEQAIAQLLLQDNKILVCQYLLRGAAQY